MADLQRSITFWHSTISLFRKKQLFSNNRFFHMSQTCKNDPKPPLALIFFLEIQNFCPNFKISDFWLSLTLSNCQMIDSVKSTLPFLIVGGQLMNLFSSISYWKNLTPRLLPRPNDLYCAWTPIFKARGGVQG